MYVFIKKIKFKPRIRIVVSISSLVTILFNFTPCKKSCIIKSISTICDIDQVELQRKSKEDGCHISVTSFYFSSL